MDAKLEEYLSLFKADLVKAAEESKGKLPILPDPERVIPQNMPPYAQEKRLFSADPFNVKDSVRTHWLKHWYREHHGMYAFISHDWVGPLAAWIGNRRCLEVMSGRGFLARALREYGVDLTATDNHEWLERGVWAGRSLLTEIEQVDAVEAIHRYAADVDFVIVSWAYMDDTSYRVVNTLAEVNPDALIIHIGELRGCTDSEEFCEVVEKIGEDEGFNTVAGRYKSWHGFKDRLRLFKAMKGH